MEVAERTANDTKGGHLARRVADNRLVLREVAQCPEEDLAACQDITRHRYFNTNNLWINLRMLKATLAAHDGVLKLPTIRNRKTLDPRDPTSPAVIQLESAMGAAIEIFAGAEAVCVGRERFAPVKLCADLLLLRSDRYTFDELMGLRPSLEATPVCVVTLDSTYYKKIDDFDARFPATPSLRACDTFTVHGDVAFAADVVCQGRVVVRNAGAAQATVAAGTLLANGEYLIGG
jgi:UTP--glucose-1-phosphate uridylyltransferase